MAHTVRGLQADHDAPQGIRQPLGVLRFAVVVITGHGSNCSRLIYPAGVITTFQSLHLLAV